MIRLLTVSFLVARLASRRLDISAQLCLDLWRHRPPIVMSLDEVRFASSLRTRIDLMFPF